jgi:8-oxo-dGTP pyrophosphatase MutT (NUDIX family)
VWPPTELLDVLHSARVSDPDQQVAKERMLQFAFDHVDALDRRCEAGHFTGSALVVDVETARTLLLFHSKAQRWLQPGGHADGEADLASVALREASEETGIDGLRVVRPAIDLDIHVFRPRGAEPRVHLDVRFLVIAPPRARPAGNHESEELRWVDLAGLAALDADEGLVRLARAGFELVERL